VRAWLARSEAKGDDGAELDLDPLDSDDEDLSSLVAKVAEWRALKLKSEAKLAARRDEVHAGRLLSRDLVRRHVFGALEQLHVRLLRDSAITLARRARSAASTEDATTAVQDLISSQLTAARSQVVSALRNSRTGDNPPAVEAIEQPEERERVQVHARVSEALAATMRSKAAPRVLDLVLRSFARRAAGQPWTAAVFDGALKLREPMKEELLHALGNVLVAHAEAAVREADTALNARHIEELSHAPA